MQYGVDIAGFKRGSQDRRKDFGDSSIDDLHLGFDAMCRQLRHKIAGAILACEIEQRSLRADGTRGD